MINKITKTLILLLIFTTTSCSYKPIFSEKNYNFGIEKIELEGEKEINRVIKNRLELIKRINQKNKKQYKLKVETDKDRKIISKDSKGDPVKFEFIIFANIEILEGKNLLTKKEIKINNIYNNDSDKFKLEQKERIIVNNLSRIVTDEIISVIINLNDN